MEYEMHKEVRFQTEEPSKVDLYGGQGHKNAANALKHIVEHQPDTSLIGLEGELGAGKSSVIQMVQDSLSDTHEFRTFDVDTHSHSSIKATLIRVLHNWISKLDGLSDLEKSKIDNAKDKALGNSLVYEKSTSSKINIWVLFYIISFVFLLRLGPDAVEHFFSTLGLMTEGVWWFSDSFNFQLKDTIEALFGLSIIPVVFAHWAFSKDNQSSIKRLVEAFKRNSTDKISEKMLVTREVGSLDLQEALRAFIDSIPAEKKLVFVIDNIDRVEDHLVREVWSDLNIISGLSSDKFTIILPFSERHVAKALSESEDISGGLEFISKRLPVTVRTPPVVEANWHKVLEDYWKETLGKLEGVQTVAELVQIWKRVNGAVTPRMLKRLVNDIAVSNLCLPSNEVTGLVSAVYVFVYKKQQCIDFLDLISTDINLGPNSNERVKECLELTQELLSSNSSPEEWALELAMVHYQTDKDHANSELLERPIEQAINDLDETKILNLSKLIGFEINFSRLIEKVPTEHLYNLAYRVSGVTKVEDGVEIIDLANQWMKEWMPVIASFSEYDTSRIEVAKFEGYEKLCQNGVEVDRSRINREFEVVEKNIIESRNLDSEISEKDIQIKWLHRLGRLIDRKPHFLSNIEGFTFVEYLWLFRNSLESWDIESIQLTAQQRQTIFEYIYIKQETYIDVSKAVLPLEHLLIWLGQQTTSSGDNEVIFNVEPSKFKEMVDAIFEKCPEVLPFMQFWETEDRKEEVFLSGDISNRKVDVSKEDACKALVALFVYSIKHDLTKNNIQFNGTNGVPVRERLRLLLAGHEPDQITEHLKYFLRFGDLTKAAEYSDMESIGESIQEAIKWLFENKQTSDFDINEIITNRYDDWFVCFIDETEEEYVDSGLNEGISKMISMLAESQSELKEPIEAWDQSFVDHICRDVLNQQVWIDFIMKEFSGDRSNKNALTANIFDPAQNLRVLVDLLFDRDCKLENAQDLTNEISDISNKYAAGEKFDIDRNWIRAIIGLLPAKDKERILNHASVLFYQSPTGNDARNFFVDVFDMELDRSQMSDKQNQSLVLSILEDDSLKKWVMRKRPNIEKWDKKSQASFKEHLQLEETTE